MNSKSKVNKEILNYYAPFTIGTLNWAETEGLNEHRLALGSLMEKPVNYIQVVELSRKYSRLSDPIYPDYQVTGRAKVEYPVTKIKWKPDQSYQEGTELLATTGDMLRLWEYKTIDESDWDKEDEQEECEDEVAFDEIDDDEFMDGEREEEKRGGNQMREGSNMGMDGMAQGGEMDRRNKLHRDVSTGSGDIGNGIERTEREEGGEGKGMMVQWGDKRWDRQKGGESSTSSRKQGIYDRIKLKAKLGQKSPLTSFDWNRMDKGVIITSSVDTTCTVWDIETQQAKTQLIAHDKEVYDVVFVTNSSDMFFTCGADGSIRMFDLRALDHSTILYEEKAVQLKQPNGANFNGNNGNIGDNNDPNSINGGYYYYNYENGAEMQNITHQKQQQQQQQREYGETPALLRIATSQMDVNYVAALSVDNNKVSIVDVRMPGGAVVELMGHQGAVTAVEWSPTTRNSLCTSGTDSRVLVWDINRAISASNNELQQMISGDANMLDRRRPPLSQQPGSLLNTAFNRPVAASPNLSYAARMPVGCLSWSRVSSEWIGIAYGRTVQALRL